MKTGYLSAAAALALFAGGCSQDEGSQWETNAGDNSTSEGTTAQAGPVWFFGTVHRLPENGGTWVVRTAGGTQYQPTSLPEEFQVDGMAVEVKAEKHGQPTAQNTLGQAIEIVEIRRKGG